MITVGLDEVGRGCWAGPVVAGATILNHPIDGLKDSKLLTARDRKRLAGLINQHATATGLGWVSAAEVDAWGLTKAVSVAMQRALAQIDAAFDEAIIDGNYNFLPNEPRARTLIKADALIPAVSAASIIAKVARDTYMQQMALQYPEHGFESHVGYGTALHAAQLKVHGLTDLHRRSFKPIRALL